MPLALQVKLLRAIETRCIERLGSNVAVPLDIRFVAASKADLQAGCRAGQFRQDLSSRLNVVSLTLPPLRETREAVHLLVNHLAREPRGRPRRPIPAPARQSAVQGKKVAERVDIGSGGQH